MPGAEGAEVGVERAEGETHHHLPDGLGVHLREDLVRAKGRTMAGQVEPDELRLPPAGVHKIHEGLEAALGAGHRRDDGEEGHGGWAVARSE